jgi:hypothetical protein
VSDTPRNDDQELRCRHCGDVIGVYEPMVVISRGVPVRTSAAARKDDATLLGDPFHSQCFAEREAG